MARRPWPPLLLASLTGWSALVAYGQWTRIPDYCGAYAGWSTWDARAGGAALSSGRTAELLPGLLLSWLLMVLAMMAPLLAQPVMHLWDRSLARRRPRAIAVFSAAYLAVWMLAGLLLMAVAVTLGRLGGAVSIPALALALAAALLWQIAPAKQACLNRCHGVPRLSAFGLAADRDCLRYGLVAGLWCVGACWALMLVPLLAGSYHAASMAVVSILLLAERQAAARPAGWGARFVILRKAWR